MPMLALFKSLADPTRLRLINILRQGEFTVQELVDILGMGQSRVSRHLKILLDAALLQVKREGTWAYYRLAETPSLLQRLWPQLEGEFDGLSEAAADQQAIVRVLAARRQRSQLFFEQHAREWDRLSRQLLTTPAYLDQLLADLPMVDRLLEIGVGTGSLLEPLCRVAQRVIGVDQSPGMLDAARQRVREAALERVELRLGEMEHLPLESESIDLVLLNMVLHHAPDPLAVLREAARVLCSGGLVVIADLQRHQGEWVREKMADQWLGFTSDELTGWAEKSGLNVIESLALPGEKSEFGVMLTRLQKL